MSIKERVFNIFPEERDIPRDMKIEKEIHQKEYVVNGEVYNWDGDTKEVFSPIFVRSGSNLKQVKIGSYPLLSEKEAMEALNSAYSAYSNGRGDWALMPLKKRIRYIEEFKSRMQEKRDEIVKLLMWEIGKSFRESLKEFDRTIEYIDNTIKAVIELERSSSKFVIEENIIGRIKRSPLGVVLCMGPFNYPLNETFTTLIPALIMGNTVIFKPPKLGVLLHYPLLEIIKDTFPPGVVNTIYGEGQKVITPVISSGKIDVLAFIGSSRVADILKKQHPKPHRLRSVLGLEAKNPAIVLDDCDIFDAVDECVKGSLSFNGQRCTALKILFVHKNVVNDFVRLMSSNVETLNFGMPWEEDVFITPLPEPGKPLYLKELIDDAIKHGADIVNSNGGIYYKTFFYPAILYPVNNRMRIYYEEQFGPVVPIVPFDDIEDPLRYIMESSYGQQVSIFGRNIDKLARLIDILANQVCRININTMCQRGPDIFPFAGRKDSGEGTLSVSDALRVFSIRTIVAAKDNSLNKDIFRNIIKEHKSNFLASIDNKDSF